MIKIRTAQLAAVPSHIRKNLKQIEKEAALARAEGAHILVLPEMCLTGYLIGDIWDQNAFLKECERANEKSPPFPRASRSSGKPCCRLGPHQ